MPLSSSFTDPLSPSRTINWYSISLAVIAYLILVSIEFAILPMFPGLGTVFTLCFSMLLLMIEIVLFFGIFHMKPRDVGLVAPHIMEGIIVYLCVWICYQIVFAILGLVGQGQIIVASYWVQPQKYPTIFMTLLTYVLGIALTEEILFRGFLVPQIWQLLKHGQSPWGRLIKTLAISQTIFALIHIPSLLFQRADPIEILVRLCTIFIIGVLLALVWIQTQNLFIAVAVHALTDATIPLFHQTVLADTSWFVFITSIILLLLYSLRQPGLRQSLTTSGLSL
jgi:uncharacterized protein